MIIPRSIIKIVDNTGAKLSRCIRVLSQSPKTQVGDLVVVSLQKVKRRHVHKGQKKEQVKKGEIRLALLIQTARPIYRKDGTKLQLSHNYALLVTTKGKTLGSRFKKPVPKEIRCQKWLKLISIAPSLF